MSFPICKRVLFSIPTQPWSAVGADVFADMVHQLGHVDLHVPKYIKSLVRHGVRPNPPGTQACDAM